MFVPGRGDLTKHSIVEWKRDVYESDGEQSSETLPTHLAKSESTNTQDKSSVSKFLTVLNDLGLELNSKLTLKKAEPLILSIH